MGWMWGSASSRSSGTPRASFVAFASGTAWLHWGCTKLSFQVPPGPNLLGFCGVEVQLGGVRHPRTGQQWVALKREGEQVGNMSPVTEPLS